MNATSTTKRLLSLLVCLSMVLGMIPMLQATKASAAEVPTPHDCSDWTQIEGEVSSLSEGSYVLSGDMTLTTAVRIDSNVKICLNGNIMTGTTAPYFNIVDGGTLTVFDCSSAHSGKIQGLGTAEAKNNQFLIIIYAGGHLELNDVTITGHNTTAYGTVYVNGSMTMNGGQISYCSGGRTGAVYSDADAPVITINGGSIHHNTGSTVGGGILCYGANAKVTLNSGSIANNTAVQQGSGLLTSRCPNTKQRPRRKFFRRGSILIPKDRGFPNTEHNRFADGIASKLLPKSHLSSELPQRWPCAPLFPPKTFQA